MACLQQNLFNNEDDTAADSLKKPKPGRYWASM